MDLKSYIRDVPDFPQKGIIFKDITTLLKDKMAFGYAVDKLTEKYASQNVDKIVGIESRGFIFAGAAAYKLGCGLVVARKPGKLPAAKVTEEYTLEYGTDSIELHKDALSQNERILIIDDLLATGGTAIAVIKLVEKLMGNIIGVEFLIELEFLKGREKFSNYPLWSYIKY